jgi:hypothetical protein
MIKVCWNTEGVIDRITELRADGPLPRRTVIVPRSSVGHRLRCGLIRRGRVDLLIGTSFVTIRTLATEILQLAGLDCRDGEQALRLSRLRALFRDGLDPEPFTNGLVMSTPGWDEALVRTIFDLEQAGLTPDDVAAVDAGAAGGLATVWQKLNEAAGPSTTGASQIREATTLLEQSPATAADWGSVLAAVSGYTEGVEAQFIQAIPRAQIVLRAVRPLREGFTERVGALFGSTAKKALEEATSPCAGETDLQVVKRYIFESPDVHVADLRVHAGAEPDATMVLEEHAGVEAEVEAAADWVAREIIEHATPLEEIAVLVPRLDPIAQFVCERLRRLPWEGEFPVHLAGGCALTSTTGGRLLAVTQALQHHLSVDQVAQVLPMLRTDGEDCPIGKGAAMDLAQSLGTVGGSVSNPTGGLAWTERLARRESDIAAAAERVYAADEDDELQVGMARGLLETERLLRDLRAVRPGLEALVGIAAAVLEGQRLPEIWSQLRDFLGTWVLRGREHQALAQLDAALEEACDEGMCRTLSGSEALAHIETTLRGLRVPSDRLGESAVYVGTVAGAVGLTFQAVRVIGLTDGTIPAAPREDTVLPDEVREKLAHATTAPTLALASLHNLYQVIQDTSRQLVLSTPRLTMERSYREPSSVFLEVATALGRPRADADDDGIPNLDQIRRREFGPARAEAHAFRRDHPIGQAAWQDRAADDCGRLKTPQVPVDWVESGALDLQRIIDLQFGVGQRVMDGILGADAIGPTIPGMSAQRPLSASRWRMLLVCPHQFLYESLLGWSAPPEPKSQRELEPLAYGSLCHKVLERFFTGYGTTFFRGKESLVHWRQELMAIAETEFEQMLEHYSLAGNAARQQQLDRVQREVGEFLDYLWEQVPCRFVAVEQSFGYREPIALQAGDDRIYVRGFIDLIDVSGKTVRVWDVKTGKCHPRIGEESGPSPTLDAQLALYGMALRQMAEDLGVDGASPRAIYAHTNERQGRERSYDEDYDELEEAGQQWLAATAQLMAERSFPRCPDKKQCPPFCAFGPVCGPGATNRAAELLNTEDGALAVFAEVRL